MLLTKREVKMAGNWPSFFFLFFAFLLTKIKKQGGGPQPACPYIVQPYGVKKKAELCILG